MHIKYMCMGKKRYVQKLYEFRGIRQRKGQTTASYIGEMESSLMHHKFCKFFKKHIAHANIAPNIEIDLYRFTFRCHLIR